CRTASAGLMPASIMPDFISRSTARVMQTETLLQPIPRSDYLHDFPGLDWEDSLAAAHLTHYARQLLDSGLHEPELEEALHKAIIACRAAGLAVAENFKAVFVCSAA